MYVDMFSFLNESDWVKDYLHAIRIGKLFSMLYIYRT